MAKTAVIIADMLNSYDHEDARRLAETVREQPPFIAKGRHSAFYQTALDHLLRSEEVQRLVLAGQVTEQCILYSALDAYIRGYDLVVPPDAVAHIDG